MSLVALRCPSCGHALPSANERRIFSCEQGHGPFRAASDRLWPLPAQRLLALRPLPAEGELLLLPIWILPVDTQWQQRGALPSELRIPALGVQRLPLLMDLARKLSRHRVPWTEEEARGLAFDGAELDLEDARSLAEFVALGLRPGWPAEAEVDDFHLKPEPGRLVLLPAWRFGGRIEELVGGVEFPGGLFEGYALQDRRSSWMGTLSRLGR